MSSEMSSSSKMSVEEYETFLDLKQLSDVIQEQKRIIKVMDKEYERELKMLKLKYADLKKPIQDKIKRFRDDQSQYRKTHIIQCECIYGDEQLEGVDYDFYCVICGSRLYHGHCPSF